MPRRLRIFIILLVCTIVGGLIICLSRPSEPRYEVTWADQVHYWFRELTYKLGARRPGNGNSCIANLKQIDGAKATWALEQKKVNSDVPTATDLFGMTAYIRDTPVCPGGGTYTLSPVMLKPVCSLAHRGHSL